MEMQQRERAPTLFSSADEKGSDRSVSFTSPKRARLRAFINAIVDFSQALWESYSRRLYVYVMALVVLSLLMYAVGRRQFYGIGSRGWYDLVGAIILIDTTTSIVDFTVLYLIDAMTEMERLRFYIDCFKGSFGLAGTIFMINYWLSDWPAPKAVAKWSAMMSTCAIIVFLYIVRQFFQRRGYSVMTAARFGDRLELMDKQHRIVSILANWDPLKDVPVPEGTPLPSSTPVKEQQIPTLLRQGSSRGSSRNGSIQGQRSRNASVSTAHNTNTVEHLNMDGTTSMGPPVLAPPQRSSNSVFRTPPPPTVGEFREQYKTLPTTEGGDETPSSSRNQSPVSSYGKSAMLSMPSGPYPVSPSMLERKIKKIEPVQGIANNEEVKEIEISDSDAEEIARKNALKRLVKGDFLKRFRNSVMLKRENEVNKSTNIFKNIVESLGHGEDEEETEGATNDSQKVELFWSRIKSATQRKVVIPTYNGPVTLRRKLEGRNFGSLLYKHLTRLRWPGTRSMTGALVAQMLRTHANTAEDGNDLAKASVLLFRCEEKESLTKEMVTLACEQVVKDHRDMALAITDYLRLHKQIDVVADTLFWVVMFILAQIVLELDTLTVLAPLLTVIVFCSFALGATLSNIFMSLGFVLFMMPFDVGDRISFNNSGTLTIANVKNINLLSTVVVTTKHEKIHIPNHTLFSEKITNLRHSYEGVYEIPISFSLCGPSANKMATITKFWEQVRNFALEEGKADWKDCFVACHTVDYTRNNFGYSVWLTSRWSFGQSETIANARRRFLEKLVTIQQSLGINFMVPTQPIEFSSATEKIPITLMAERKEEVRRPSGNGVSSSDPGESKGVTRRTGTFDESNR